MSLSSVAPFMSEGALLMQKMCAGIAPDSWVMILKVCRADDYVAIGKQVDRIAGARRARDSYLESLRQGLFVALNMGLIRNILGRLPAESGCFLTCKLFHQVYIDDTTCLDGDVKDGLTDANVNVLACSTRLAGLTVARGRDADVLAAALVFASPTVRAVDVFAGHSRHTLAALKAQNVVKALTLRDCTSPDIFAGVTCLQSLRSLTVCRNRVAAVDMQLLTRMTALTRLCIDRGESDLRPFLAMPLVEFACERHVPPTTFAGQDCVLSPTLEKLEVKANGRGEPCPRFYAALAASSVRHFSAEHVPITVLPRLSNVTTLEIWATALADERRKRYCGDVFRVLPDMPNLREFVGKYFASRGVSSLARCAKLERLMLTIETTLEVALELCRVVSEAPALRHMTLEYDANGEELLGYALEFVDACAKARSIGTQFEYSRDAFYSGVVFDG